MTLADVWTVAIGFGTLVLTIVIIGLMIKSSNDTAHTRIEGNINKVEKNVNDNFNRVNDNFNRLFLERLGLPGRAKKIHERVCRYGGHVPIRGVWRARTMTGAVRWGPGLGGTPGTCASNTSNEKRRS